jgi:hypothetical protein
MKNLNSALSLLLISSFAIANDYSEFNKPKVNFVNFSDPNSGLFVSSDYIGDPRKIYLESVKNFSINNDPQMSCYGNSQSVNFINHPESIISQLRLYSSKSEFEISHTSTISKDGFILRAVSTESKQVNLTVRRKMCFKEIDGVVLKIISEIYEKEIK